MGDTDAHEAEVKSAYFICSHDHWLEICLITEKNKIQEIRMVFHSQTDGFPKGMSINLICIGLKL